MPGKAYYSFKKFLAKVGILAIILAVIAFFAYVYILPTASPEIITNPRRLVEAPERQRIYEITDEFINTYAYVERTSQLEAVGSEEWVRSTLQTLETDKASYSRLDPLRLEGDISKTYKELVETEIRLLKRYVRLYEMERAPDEDISIDGTSTIWDYLFTCYDAFKTADAEYQAQLDQKEASKEAPKEGSQGESQEAPQEAPQGEST